MSDTNGQQVPLVGGLPITSVATQWSYGIHEIGRADDSGEKVFLLRFMLPTGVTELWAPASFLREMGEKLVAQAVGLSIARDVPPSPQ